MDVHEVRLTFDQLALIYNALQAAKILAAVETQNELVDDTIAVIDQSLETAFCGGGETINEIN